MYQHIMVPLDGSELAECVLPHVETIVKGSNAKKVTLIRVVEPLHLYGGVESGFSLEERERLEEDSINIARGYLDQVAKRLGQKGVTAEPAVLHGKVADELAEYVNKNGVDLVILSTHGRSGISRLVWGSVADRIIRSVGAPVLIVRAPGCVLHI